MMEESHLKIACATDDGINFSEEHFGSAKKFLIYELNLDTGDTKIVKTIENDTPEERTHGDPEKAKKISELLKDVQVLIGFAMGPNIIRMRKKFVPIISREKNIETALSKLKSLLNEIKSSLEKEEKDVLFIR